MKEIVQTGVVGIAGTAMGVLVADSISQITIWLMVMFFVVLCDLAAGLRKSMKMGEKIRITRAFRDTMGKMVVYASFVIMVVLIGVAAGHGTIAKWCILFICSLEGASIIGNLLKPLGYDVSLSALIVMLLKKIFSIDKDYSKDIIVKNDKQKKEDEAKQELPPE